MPAAPIGSSWATGSWVDTGWESGTWADGSAIFRVPVEEFFPWQRPVLAFLNTPPGSPAKGDRYLVSAVATGDWAGYEDAVAWWNGSAWAFDLPSEGWFAYNLDDHTLYLFTSAWAAFP